jgi:hypothetical protein
MSNRKEVGSQKSGVRREVRRRGGEGASEDSNRVNLEI